MAHDGGVPPLGAHLAQTRGVGADWDTPPCAGTELVRVATMERLRPSMQVYAINDQRVGEVRSTRNCCFEVELSGEQQERRSLTLPAIFNVTPGEVTL